MGCDETQCLRSKCVVDRIVCAHTWLNRADMRRDMHRLINTGGTGEQVLTEIVKLATNAS